MQKFCLFRSCKRPLIFRRFRDSLKERTRRTTTIWANQNRECTKNRHAPSVKELQDPPGNLISNSTQSILMRRRGSGCKEMKLRIQAGQFYDYERCKHRVYLDRYGNSSEKTSDSPFLRLLWERGIQHEARVISKLSSEREIAHVEAPTEEEAFAQTLAFMTRGVDLIYQGILRTPDGIGRPDLLEKTAGPSRWGDYHYVPIDIKSGGGFENPQTRERVKKEYAHQVIF